MHLNFYLEGLEFINICSFEAKLPIYCGHAQTISWLQCDRQTSFPKWTSQIIVPPVASCWFHGDRTAQSQKSSPLLCDGTWNATWLILLQEEGFPLTLVSALQTALGGRTALQGRGGQQSYRWIGHGPERWLEPVHFSEFFKITFGLHCAASGSLSSPIRDWTCTPRTGIASGGLPGKSLQKF